MASIPHKILKRQKVTPSTSGKERDSENQTKSLHQDAGFWRIDQPPDTKSSAPQSHRVSSFITDELQWNEKFELHLAEVRSPDGKPAEVCKDCRVAQTIIHSNGIQDTRLEIHCGGTREGRSGSSVSSNTLSSSHCVLHTRCSRDGEVPVLMEQQIVEFPPGNSEFIRQFLHHYSVLRQREDFTLCLQVVLPKSKGKELPLPLDPYQAAHSMTVLRGAHGNPPIASQKLSGFTSSTLSVEAGPTSVSTAHSGSGQEGRHNGIGWEKPFIPQVSRQGAEGRPRDNSIASVDGPPPVIAPTVANPKPSVKTNAAAQRERTGKLGMADLAEHFHLPINAAAQALGICPTVLKKVCRRNGMRRWPHRKIKSIERIIATLEQTVAESGGKVDEIILNEIIALKNERSQLCEGLMGDL